MKKILFLSSVITNPFGRYLNDEYNVSHAPLGTIFETLYHPDSHYDIIIILLDTPFIFQNTITPQAFDTLERLNNALQNFRQHSSSAIVINTISEISSPIFTPNDQHFQQELGKINATIASWQQTLSSCYVVDFFALSLQYGLKNLINVKNRYLFQTPFTKLALELLSSEIKKALTLLSQPRIKAIAVDADNTLWGGIIGEDGLEGIQCDENYPGIVYRQFQSYLLQLKESGIILILLSKNNEEDVDEVFTHHALPLKKNDFVAAAVNWQPKSDNLRHILKTLNLSTQGIIFLDDNPVEIAHMEHELGIDCYTMNPKNPLENLETLRQIVSLQALVISEEDSQKTQLYQQENNRQSHACTTSNHEDFIASLESIITVGHNRFSHIDRMTQLVNKTNQFNLTTIRRTSSQIGEIMKQGDVYDFSVSDRFGNMGLVGVVIILDHKIDTFLLSCRVLGRGIEQAILSHIASIYGTLHASYVPTSKNQLVETFYDNNGFVCVDNNEVKHYSFVGPVVFHPSIKVIPCQ